MGFKRVVVRMFLRCADGWNQEIHRAVEDNVFREHRRLFPGGTDGGGSEIRKMREFYHARLMTTANLLVTCVALLVAITALLASIVAIFR
jgi:hypothetical protein